MAELRAEYTITVVMQLRSKWREIDLKCQVENASYDARPVETTGLVEIGAYLFRQTHVGTL